MTGPAAGIRHSSEARRTLEDTLSECFAYQRISGLTMAALRASLLPTLVLWLHAWHPLPDLVTFFAVLGWGSCAVLVVGFTIGARKLKARLSSEDHRRLLLGVVRVHFAGRSDAVPPVSAILLVLAAAAGTLLWLHALCPGLLSPSAVSLSSRAWILLAASALANQCAERLS